MPTSRHSRGKATGRTPHAMDTFFVHGQFQSRKWDYDHHLVPPISSSAAYRLGSAERGAQGFEDFAREGLEPGRQPIYIYDRLDEPVRGMLEESLAQAERGGCALTFATGMAAVSAALGIACEQGDEIVSHHILYGCTYSLFTNWMHRVGVKVRLVDLRDPEKALRAMTSRTRVVYFETPVNPTMELLDIAQIVKTTRARTRLPRASPRRGESRGARSRVSTESRPPLVIVDNTFATPWCQRPLEHGADMVIHSLTKNIGGFGTDMGGAVITREEFKNPLLLYRKDFGGVLAPKSAWPILAYGLPSLSVRIRKQMDSCQTVARFLERHPKIARVNYPGLVSFPQYALARRQMVDYTKAFAPGTLLYFTLKGTPEEAARRCHEVLNWIARNSYSITLAVSLGQVRTLIENPVSMTHAAVPAEEQKKSGLTGSGLRLSIGLEDPLDLCADLEKALAQCDAQGGNRPEVSRRKPRG